MNDSDLDRDPAELDKPPDADIVPDGKEDKKAKIEAKKDRADILMEKMKKSKDVFMKRKPKKEQLYWLYRLAMNRRYLNSSFWNTIRYFARDFCCCTKKSTSDRLMDKGIGRLEKNLDMIKLLTTLQEIQDMKNVTFDKHDKLLLKL